MPCGIIFGSSAEQTVMDCFSGDVVIMASDGGESAVCETVEKMFKEGLLEKNRYVFCKLADVANQKIHLGIGKSSVGNDNLAHKGAPENQKQLDSLKCLFQGILLAFFIHQLEKSRAKSSKIATYVALKLQYHRYTWNFFHPYPIYNIQNRFLSKTMRSKIVRPLGMTDLPAHKPLKDYFNIIDNTIYWDVNSVRYEWVCDQPHNAFPEEICKAHTLANHTIVFNDPLSAVVTVEGTTVTIEGVETTTFMGATRETVGDWVRDRSGRPTRPRIQSAKITLG